MSTPPAAPANKGKGKSDKKNKNNDHSSPDNKPLQDLESGDPEKNQPEKRALKKKMTAKTQNNDNNHNNQETLSRVALEPQATEVRLESSATTATRASSQDEPANAWGSPASPFPKSTPAEACAAEALKEPKKKFQPSMQPPLPQERVVMPASPSKPSWPKTRDLLPSFLLSLLFLSLPPSETKRPSPAPATKEARASPTQPQTQHPLTHFQPSHPKKTKPAPTPHNQPHQPHHPSPIHQNPNPTHTHIPTPSTATNLPNQQSKFKPEPKSSAKYQPKPDCLNQPRKQTPQTPKSLPLPPLQAPPNLILPRLTSARTPTHPRCPISMARHRRY